MKPVRVDIINNTFAIAWDDGAESFIGFEALRKACPCAGCKGEKTVMTSYRPEPPRYTPASFELGEWRYVGGYAIHFAWRDGHASGIYPFDYLRSLETKE
jgi:DUF971 family protein